MGWQVRRAHAADMAAVAGSCMDVYDTRGATRAISEFVDDLSQWWLRRSRRRLSRGDELPTGVLEMVKAFTACIQFIICMCRTQGHCQKEDQQS